MRALAREGGVLEQVCDKGRDGHGVVVDGCGSWVVLVEFERWVSEIGCWEDEKLDLVTKMRSKRKKKQRRMSLRLIENGVLDFMMVLDGLEFCFGERERERERERGITKNGFLSFRYLILIWGYNQKKRGLSLEEEETRNYLILFLLERNGVVDETWLRVRQRTIRSNVIVTGATVFLFI